MASLTKSLRDKVTNDPLRKIKQQQVVPGWLEGAGVYVAGALVVLVIGFVAFKGFTNDDPPLPSTGSSGVAQQEVNPYEDLDAGSTAVPLEDSPSGGSDGSPAVELNSDYASLEMISVEVESSSLNSRIPEGAYNVALAGAEATVTGDWTETPSSKVSREDRYLGSQVDYDTVRLAEPAGADTNSTQSFTFLFDAEDADGAKVQFSVTVEWGSDTYEVVVL